MSTPGLPFPIAARRASERGSATLAALAVLAITLVTVGIALTEARSRFRTSHHSFRWSQASQAAEAGAELALMTAQKDSWVADGWTTPPGPPGSPAVSRGYVLGDDVPNAGAVNSNVEVDTVTVDAEDWLRIRAVGKADLYGARDVGPDPQDNLLRKLSFQVDRTDGSALGSAARSTRVLEVLARRTRPSPFRYVALLQKSMAIGSGSVLDSFDSADAAKSTNSLYDLSKRQSNAHIGINDTQGSSNLGDSYVYGDLSFGGPAPAGTSNVQGAITNSFLKTVGTVVVPTWTSFNATPGAIASSMTLTGGTRNAPARYKVSDVQLDDPANVVTLETHAAGVESFIEVWVTGSFQASNTARIVQKSGVHVTYFVEGNVDIEAASLTNENNVASYQVFNVVNPPTGTPQTVRFRGSGAVIAAVNAPGADFTLQLGVDFSGAVIGRTLAISDGSSLHFDEALIRAEIGTESRFKVMSWLEAVR